MTAVILNGNSYDASQFAGYGYNEVVPATGMVRFPDSIFTDLLAELAGAATAYGVSPGAAGGFLRSNGSAWVRVSGIPAADVNPGTFGAGLFMFSGILGANLGIVVKGASSAASAANQLVCDFPSAGTARMTVFGPDAATNGLLQLTTRRSDNTNIRSVILLTDTTLSLGTGGLGSSYEVVVASLYAINRLSVSDHTPSSAAEATAPGRISWDADYIYVSVGTDEWKRALLTTWV